MPARRRRTRTTRGPSSTTRRTTRWRAPRRTRRRHSRRGCPGSASGLRVTACMTAPATPSATPTMMPTIVRGSRSSRTMRWSVSRPSYAVKAAMTSPTGIGLAPTASEAITATKSNPNRNAMPSRRRPRQRPCRLRPGEVIARRAPRCRRRGLGRHRHRRVEHVRHRTGGGGMDHMRLAYDATRGATTQTSPTGL